MFIKSPVAVVIGTTTNIDDMAFGLTDKLDGVDNSGLSVAETPLTRGQVAHAARRLQALRPPMRIWHHMTTNVDAVPVTTGPLRVSQPQGSVPVPLVSNSTTAAELVVDSGDFGRLANDGSLRATVQLAGGKGDPTLSTYRLVEMVAKLDMIYDEYPDLKLAFKKLGWSEQDQYTFLQGLRTRGSEEPFFPPLRLLPGLLNMSKNNAGFTPNQIISLFKKITTMRGAKNPDDFEGLSAVIEASIEAKLPPSWIHALLSDIVSNAERVSIGSAFEALPAVLKALTEAKLSPGWIFELVEEMVVNGDIVASADDALPAALKASTAAQLTQGKIVSLFKKIAAYCDDNTAEIYRALPAALKASTDAQLPPRQIAILLAKIAKVCGNDAADVYRALPAALKAATKAQLTLDQIVSLFGKIPEKCGDLVDSAYAGLSAVLEASTAAKLTPNQMVVFFEEIVEKCGYATGSTSMTISGLLEHTTKARFTPDQTLGLLGKIVDEFGSFIEDASSSLSAALKASIEAKLPPDQIVNLFGEIVDEGKLNGRWEDYSPESIDETFNALSAVLKASTDEQLTTEQILQNLREGGLL